jgi:hypothetical protein
MRKDEHEHLQRYATKTELARSLGVDPRSLNNKTLRPAALLVAAGKTIPLFYWNDYMPVALAVNAQSNTPLSHAEL